MVRVLHAVLALLVVLAGCSGSSGGETPTPAEHDLSISVSNEHDATDEGRVTAVPAQVEGIEVRYENGTIHRFDVASFDALPGTTLRNATGTATTDSAELSRASTVDRTRGAARRSRMSPRTRRSCTSSSRRAIRPDGSLHSAVTCSDDVG